VLDANIGAVVAGVLPRRVLPESPSRVVFAQGLAKKSLPAAGLSLTPCPAVAIIPRLSGVPYA
jgi:hypothetical protein